MTGRIDPPGNDRHNIGPWFIVEVDGSIRVRHCLDDPQEALAILMAHP
jgi:hypothetical protein